MMTFFRKGSLKKGFLFLCFLIVCICDQRLGSVAGGMQLAYPNIVVSILSCIALSHYPLSSYRRRLFWILLLPCVAGTGIVVYLKWPTTYYFWQLISGAIAAVLYCCTIIQTGFAIYFRRGIPGGRLPGGGLVFLLFLLILFSRHDKYNGALLCLSILLIYLTDFSALEFEWMIKALCAAVIVAFFIIQGLAFVFRPYDTLRYLGMYANTNINALFYQMVYCAFLACFCILEVKKEHLFLRLGSFCFACAMWSFVLLTMCRSAMVGMAIATLLGFVIILWNRRGKLLLRGFAYASGMLLAIVLSFPIVYGAVRYLPPVFHHPIWFMAEYSDARVKSWDPYDSEKYTDWRDVLQENFGRVFMDLIPIGGSSKLDVGAAYVLQGRIPVVFAAGQPSIVLCAVEGDETVPSVTVEETATAYSRTIIVRSGIYRYYFSQLNLRGHLDAENGVRVNGYYAPHAHNIFLQYAFNYGVPAGLVLLVYMVASGIRLFRLCLKDRKEMGMAILPLLLLVSIFGFSMFEMSWRCGQLSHTLVLLAPCFAWRQTEAG